MKKEEMKQVLIGLKGIGESKADALIAAGFDSVQKIKDASLEELSGVSGISESVATSLKKQLKSVGTPKKKTTQETPSKEAEKPDKPKMQQPTHKPVEKKEEPEKPKKQKKEKPAGEPKGFEPKKKPVLPDDITHFLSVRKQKKKQTPSFYREEWFRYKRLGTSWRRPDGISSKMRRNFKYRPSKVRVGFRGPKKARGLHPSGFQEVMVYTVDDLTSIDPKTQAARIGGSVGMRKRQEIEEKAKDLDIRVLNRQR